MSETIAVLVRYKSLYISLPSSVKQQREMTKLCVVYVTWTTMAHVSSFHLKLTAVVAYVAVALARAIGVPNRSRQLRISRRRRRRCLSSLIITQGQLLTWRYLAGNLIQHGDRKQRNVWLACGRSASYTAIPGRFSYTKLRVKKNA